MKQNIDIETGKLAVKTGNAAASVCGTVQSRCDVNGTKSRRRMQAAINQH